MSIHHNLIFGCFFYCILIMIYNPLIIMIFSSWENIAYIAALYNIVSIFLHELIRLVHVTLIVTNRSRCFMMHNHFYSFRFCIFMYLFNIKIRIWRYKIENVVFGATKPVFPALIPAFN